MKKFLWITLFMLVPSLGFSSSVSLMMGEGNLNLPFINNIIGAQYYYGNFLPDQRFTTSFMSLLGQNDVDTVDVHAVLDNRGSTNLQIVYEATDTLDSSIRVVLAPIGSAPGRDYNRLCRSYRNRDDLVFVMAAGNERVNYDFYQADMNDCEARNIVIVTSLTERENLSSFSNFGQVVRIGAIGENLLVQDEFGWGEITGSGPAAATVAARMAEFSDRNPRLRGEELATEFIWSETTSEFRLNGYIRNGRILRQ